MQLAGGHIDRNQFGAVKGSSTTHALVTMIHHWQEAFDSPANLVYMLFLDVSKAFDTVDHERLLSKLSTLGPPPFLTRWITAFLNYGQA